MSVGKKSNKKHRVCVIMIEIHVKNKQTKKKPVGMEEIYKGREA